MAMHGIPSVTEFVELAEGIGRHGGDGFKFWKQGVFFAEARLLEEIRRLFRRFREGAKLQAAVREQLPEILRQFVDARDGLRRKLLKVPVETERHDVVGVRHDEKRLLVFKIGTRHVAELRAAAVVLLQQIVGYVVVGELVVGDASGETLPEDAVTEDDDGKCRERERPMEAA